jgi:hypothetical protein
MQNQVLIAGLVFISLFGMLAIWRILKKNEKSPGFFELLLVLMGVVLCITGLTIENTSAIVFDMSEIAALAAAAALVQVGFWGMRVRKNSFQSRGFLALGTGIILGAAALIIPIYMQSNVEEPVINVVALSGSTSGAMTILVSDTASSNQQARFATPIPAAVPMTIPTLDAPRIVFPTPTPTPVFNEKCEATVTARLNMRDLPSTAAGAVINVLDAETTVELYAHDDSNEWWFTIIDGQQGWLFGELMTLTDECSRLPERSWNS